jgi:hypothetical protein
VDKNRPWFQKRRGTGDKTEFPDEAEFLNRIAMLRASRNDRSVVIHLLPVLFGKIAGAILVLASIVYFVSFRACSEMKKRA